MFFSFAEKKYRGNFRVGTTSSEAFIHHYMRKISGDFQMNSYSAVFVRNFQVLGG